LIPRQIEMRNLIDDIWPSGIESIIDLGCGDLWWTANLPGVMRHIGVDLWPGQLKFAQERRPVKGWEPYCQDALDFLKSCPMNYVDAVLAIDIIEHLEKGRGLELLDDMIVVAEKLVVCWAPLGMLERGPTNPDGTHNPYQVHKWGPEPEDFQSRGWEVDIYPEQHQDGGAIFAWKYLI